MFAIDVLFLRLATLYAVTGMGLGIWMGISGDHGQYPTHAHINLLGWVSFAIYGLIYRNVPAAAQSKLAPWHFRAANLGAVLLLTGIFAILSGHPEFEPLAAAGGMITLLGGALFAYILCSRPIAAQNERRSPGRHATAAQTAK